MIKAGYLVLRSEKIIDQSHRNIACSLKPFARRLESPLGALLTSLPATWRLGEDLTGWQRGYNNVSGLRGGNKTVGSTVIAELDGYKT